MLTNIFGRNWASINLISDIDFRKENNERITLFNSKPFFFRQQISCTFRFSLQTTIISNQNESCQYFRIICYCLLLFVIVFTRSQQQLLDSTMTSTTSKSSIKPPPVIVEEAVDDEKPEVPETAAAASEGAAVAESNGVNGTTEGKLPNY